MINLETLYKQHKIIEQPSPVAQERPFSPEEAAVTQTMRGMITDVVKNIKSSWRGLRSAPDEKGRKKHELFFTSDTDVFDGNGVHINLPAKKIQELTIGVMQEFGFDATATSKTTNTLELVNGAKREITKYQSSIPGLVFERHVNINETASLSWMVIDRASRFPQSITPYLVFERLRRK